MAHDGSDDEEVERLFQAVLFEDWMACIRQRADGEFEQLASDGRWYPYLPGGFAYYTSEVEALRARGDVVTDENTSVPGA
jgi:hypothetical protein